MQKARTLPSSDLLVYGQEWESWQTFFWRKRKEGNANNPNADKGFNNYLACIEGLENLGIEMDVEKNNVRGKQVDITGANSKVKVLIIPTNEELMIAMDTYRLVK